MKKRYSRKSAAPMRFSFWTAVFMLLIHAMSYLFMPLAAGGGYGEASRIVLQTVGLIFWISLLLGYVFLIAAMICRRAYVRRRADLSPDMGQRIGLLTFFSNVPGTAADVLLIIAFAAGLVVIFTGKTEHYFSFVLLAVLSLALHMHGLFNGRIYKTIRETTTRRGKNNG